MNVAGAYRAVGRVYGVAHRGGAKLAAENTMEAFALACGLGFRYLETDVRASLDGVCVAFHDAHLRRVTGRPGTLSSRTWPKLATLPVLGGHRIPRLEEALLAFPDACFCLDLKDPRAIGPLAQVIRGVARWTGCASRARPSAGWTTCAGGWGLGWPPPWAGSR